MTVDEREVKDELFWHLARVLMDDPVVERGTMMGLPCLRWNGRFFASMDAKTKDLIVKLPEARVAEIIASGRGQVFAPSRRPFREWVAISTPDEETWEALLAEAKAFAAQAQVNYTQARSRQ